MHGIYHHRTSILYPTCQKTSLGNVLFRCNLNSDLCLRLPLFLNRSGLQYLLFLVRKPIFKDIILLSII